MIALRPATPEDAGAIAAIYAPHVLAGTVSFETEAPDARAMRSRMAASAGLYPWIAATNGDGILSLDLTQLDRLGLLAMDVNDPWAKKRIGVQGFWLRDLVDLARDGKVKPVQVTRRSLDEVTEALGQLRAGKVVGRVVLVP